MSTEPSDLPLNTTKINTNIKNSSNNVKPSTKITTIRPKPDCSGAGSLYSMEDSNSMSISNSSLYPPLYHGTQLSTLNDPLEDGALLSSSSTSSSFHKTTQQMNRMSKTILANLLSQSKANETKPISYSNGGQNEKGYYNNDAATASGAHSRHQYTGCRYDLAKPPFSYASLIAQALLAAPERKLTLNQIYDWIMEKYPYYQSENSGWQNSIRHNLSLNSCFEKIARTHQEKVAAAMALQQASMNGDHHVTHSGSGGQSSNASGKGCFWTVNMDELASFTDGAFKRRKLHNNPSAGTNSMTRKKKSDIAGNDFAAGDCDNGGVVSKKNIVQINQHQKEFSSAFEAPKSLTEEYEVPEDDGDDSFTAAIRLKIFDWERMEQEQQQNDHVHNEDGDDETADQNDDHHGFNHKNHGKRGGLVMLTPGTPFMTAPEPAPPTHNNPNLNGSNVHLTLSSSQDCAAEEAEIYDAALRVIDGANKLSKGKGAKYYQQQPIPHPELLFIQRWELQRSINSDLRTDASDPLDILSAKANN